MEHKIHSRADFLNKPFFHSDGTIFSKIVLSERDKYIDVHVEMKISDCSDKITLNFYFEDEEDHENNLYKIDTMINHLKEFKRALERSSKLYFKLKEKEENKKESKK